MTENNVIEDLDISPELPAPAIKLGVLDRLDEAPTFDKEDVPEPIIPGQLGLATSEAEKEVAAHSSARERVVASMQPTRLDTSSVENLHESILTVHTSPNGIKLKTV
jgi:hypothetical protein